MDRSPSWGKGASKALLGATRVSQALVVASTDRTFRYLPLAVMTRPLARRVVPFMDGTYEVSLQLLALHREFAQRLADAMRIAETSTSDQDACGDVVDLQRKPSSRAAT